MSRIALIGTLLFNLLNISHATWESGMSHNTGVMPEPTERSSLHDSTAGVHLARANTDRRFEVAVLKSLFTEFSESARPLVQGNESLEVRVRVSLIKIQNLWERSDIRNEALESTMRIQLNWCDNALSWHPADFGGVEYVVIPGEKLWIPDIQIINALDDVYALIGDRRFDFKLHSDGCVWWHPTGTVFTRCELDLSYFPFDIQNCPIVFESAMYPMDFLNLTLRHDKAAVSLKTYSENGQWDLLKAGASSTANQVTSSTVFSRVELTLTIRRKTLYYMINIFFPCSMLASLQILTFLLPIGSEDRISQATTILLSVVVFQSIVVGDLPRTSNSVPLLCLYVDFLTGISVISIMDSVLGVYFIHANVKRPLLRALCFLCKNFEKRKATRRHVYIQQGKDGVRVKQLRSDDSIETDSLDVLRDKRRQSGEAKDCLQQSSCNFDASLNDDIEIQQANWLRTFAVWLDHGIFAFALTSSIAVPAVMFNYMPPKE